MRWRFRATDGGSGAAPDRLGAIDAARGVALVAMVAFHARWDAASLGLAGEGRAVGPGWQAFGDGVAAAFLLLSGASLVLAERRGVPLRRKLERLARLGAVALAITAGTWIAVPDLAVTCGIIHCVALGDALALPLPRAPRWSAAALACLLFALPLAPLPDAWDGAVAAWFGLGARAIASLDHRPLAPWAGFVPLGVLLMRSLPRPWFAEMTRWRALRWAGRHSLSVYLLHQAMLYPVFASLALALGTAAPAPPWVAGFDRQCRADCEATGADAALCRSTCACAWPRVATAGLGHRGSGAADHARLAAIVAACFRRSGP